jgi:hypothetical protein
MIGRDASRVQSPQRVAGLEFHFGLVGFELHRPLSVRPLQRQNSLGVAADIRDRNFLGRGMSLGGGLRYEPDLRRAMTGLSCSPPG